jgi:hypothetical protein
MPGRVQVRGWVYRWAAGLMFIQLHGCGGGNSSGSAPPPASDAIQEPTGISLYPSTSSGDGSRLFIMVTAVGTAAVRLPLAFDTGSAGITLYAPDIFPSNMVSASGFNFASGQTSISYNGITVTNQGGTRKYGSATTGRSQTGNIGYAKVTFGDGGGELATDVMPVFLYYAITENSTGQSVPPPPGQRGWFGVNDGVGLISVTGSAEPASGYPACSPDSNGSCYVVSILKYLHYADGLNAGFILSPSVLQSCDITMPGSCAASHTLMVGLNGSIEEGFNSAILTCPPGGYSGTGTINGYAVCQAGIPDATVTVSGSASGVLAATVLFDSGTPIMVFNVPTGITFPDSLPPGTSVMVGTPSGFTYSFSAGAGATDTLVQPGVATESIIGIGYFTTNSLFIDFTTSTEGWK